MAFSRGACHGIGGFKNRAQAVFFIRRFPRGETDSQFSPQGGRVGGRLQVVKLDVIILQPRYRRTIAIERRLAQDRIVAPSIEGH